MMFMNHQLLCFPIFINDKAEKAIWDTQSVILLHDRGGRPDAVHLSFWPYAMRIAEHNHHLPDEVKGTS